MLKVLNEHYYLDIDEMETYINIEQPSSAVTGETHISVVKYEMIKTMVEIIMTESEEVDETLGGKSTELSIPFKLAFNTLLNKKILNKY
jgi:hypothetical protein